MALKESPDRFPSRHDEERLALYEHYDRIYFGDHYTAYQIRAEKGFTDKYSRLRYIVANFAGILSRVMADMLFGEHIVVDVKDDKNQAFLDKLIERNELLTQLYESALVSSRKGGSVFKIRIGQRNPSDTEAPQEIIIEQISPDLYFPVFDPNGARNVPSKDVIINFIEKGDQCFIHKEINEPYKITHEVYSYDKTDKKVLAKQDPAKFGLKEVEETGISESLVKYVPNVRDGSGFWGTSDYEDLDPLFFALNNRITKVDNILDKHSDPILAVPPGVIDENGKVRKEALGMFEVDNENPGFNKPEYIVWNANLEYAFKEIDKLIQMLFMFSEVSPTTLGMDSNGAAESGRALKFRLLATIRKRNRKIRYYDQVIKDVLSTAMMLAKAQDVPIDGIMPVSVERPNVIWNDGIVNDEVEMVDIAVKRIDAGLSSPADEIAKLDDISPDEAKEKAEEIEETNLPTVPAVSNNLQAQDANQTE